VPLSGETGHKLILRTAASLNAQVTMPPSSGAEKQVPLSCWADVRFN
jgi:hypothetical protein